MNKKLLVIKEKIGVASYIISFRKIFLIILILNLLLISVFLSHGKSHAGLFGDSIPQGKEIKDSYLEQLFAPEFPYESIRIIETKEGKRYVIAKAKGKVTEGIRLHYEKDTLRKRGIVIHREGSPRTNVLLISELRLYRVVSETRYVVEYCEAIGDSLEREPGVESVVRNKGKYLIVRINSKFGKVFKRVELYPEKDAKCSTPPLCWQLPEFKMCLVYRGEKEGLFCICDQG